MSSLARHSLQGSDIFIFFGVSEPTHDANNLQHAVAPLLLPERDLPISEFGSEQSKKTEIINFTVQPQGGMHSLNFPSFLPNATNFPW